MKQDGFPEFDGNKEHAMLLIAEFLRGLEDTRIEYRRVGLTALSAPKVVVLGLLDGKMKDTPFFYSRGQNGGDMICINKVGLAGLSTFDMNQQYPMYAVGEGLQDPVPMTPLQYVRLCGVEEYHHFLHTTVRGIDKDYVHASENDPESHLRNFATDPEFAAMKAKLRYAAKHYDTDSEMMTSLKYKIQTLDEYRRASQSSAHL